MNLKKKWKKGLSLFLILFFIISIFSFGFFVNKKTNFNNFNDNNLLVQIFETNNQKIFRERKSEFLFEIEQLKAKKCLSVFINNNVNCNLIKTDTKNCLDNINFFAGKPFCLRYKFYHQKKPDIVKAIYYSAYGASSKSRIKKLTSLIKTTELNSVVIDIKEINGKVYMDFDNKSNWKIQPDLKKVILNPRKLIKELHQNEIYVIGRIVLFKDNSLVKRRPDLAIKKANKKDIWKDYKGKSWVDPGSKEVWDYNLEIARQAYLLGFDEINIDYVRFPTDGPMNNIYYPFSDEQIKEDSKWGKAKVLDKFYYYFTKKLKNEFPDIQISIDVFGQVALNYNDVSIGQILSSALLYFDAVAPMSYPSHYHWNFLPTKPGPDNYPYEVIDKTLKKASQKIDYLNLAISNAKVKKEKVLLRPNFYAGLNIEEVLNLKEIKKDKLRFWYQAFTCTWCKNYKPYGAREVELQKKAGLDNGYNSWMLWNASSFYRESYFKKK